MNIDIAPSSIANNNDRADRGSGEHPAMVGLREALGAIPAAAPASYRVYRDDDGIWRVQGQGEEQAICHPNRDEAVSAARLAVIRCAAYRLILEDDAGAIVCESYGWPPAAAGGAA